MAKMKAAGASAVYVSHSNPGEVSPDSEPGLTFAVWHAVDQRTAEESSARVQIARVSDCLAAARAAGLRVVLAMGYQIQLGSAWSDAHPDDLRRTADGAPMLTWSELRTGRTASPYSSFAQRELERYWRWVDETFVRPDANVVALNLGDEPMGSDWSPHAERAFQEAYGTPFDRAPEEARGHFLGGMLADWANAAASTWLRIDHDVHTLMTFHVQRDVPWFPDFERVFAEAPRSFTFSADTHWHDAPPDIAPLDVALLANQARTLGWLSHVYDRSLLLWSSANDWGLACDRGRSTCRFGIDEAVANVRLVTTAATEVGGDVAMTMAFGFNQRYLGAFGPPVDRHVYDPEELFRRVSAAQAQARGPMAAPGSRVPEALWLDRPALDAYVARRLPELQRERPQGAHITDRLVDLEAHRDVLLDRGVVLVAGRAARAIENAGGASRRIW